ncbi:MAG: hypothetical protein MK105_14970 [Crocinitomicaceae bacterium]|nr:hypothetical protein [Crocinitomicaceae bacterium]
MNVSTERTDSNKLKKWTKYLLLATFSFILFAVLFKEFVLTTRGTYKVKENVEISIVYNEPFLAFGLDPPLYKSLKMENLDTKQKMSLDFESVESELLFYFNYTSEIIIVMDPWRGASRYNLSTMNLVEGTQNGLKSFGFKEAKGLEKADLMFNLRGFHTEWEDRY